MALPKLRDDEMRVDWITVPCRNGCGGTTEIPLERGTKPPPMLCDKCRGEDENGYRWGELISSTEFRRLSRAVRKGGPGPKVIHLRPGDPGFDKVAAQCTPPKNIIDFVHPIEW